MLRVILGVFSILHGLVHLLYLGQSQKFFELQPGLVWLDGSWAFSRLLGNESTRLLASVSFGLAALGFVIGGAGIFLRQAWWRPVVISSGLLIMFHSDDDIALFVSCFDIPVRLGSLFQRIPFVDNRLEFSRLNQLF